MDPIAHTLAGATLAQTRLKELTPLATATLIIGANIPDIDVIVSVLGDDASLLHRRGHTHGVLAMIFLPLLLTALMVAYDRLWRRRRDPQKAPVDPRATLGLAYLGTLSHPALDWLNTYGVRLLMPFDGRWFYGDTLFIIDPWMWLLMGATIVLTYSQRRLALGAWAVLGAAMSVLITFAGMVPTPARIAWWVGVVAIIALRASGYTPDKRRLAAASCLALFCTYLGLMGLGNTLASSRVTDHLAGQGIEAEVVMTGPAAANPLAREVLARSSTHYHALKLTLWPGEDAIAPRYAPVPIEEPGPIAEAALSAPSQRGFANWVRFPVFEVQSHDEGHTVFIRDLRYVEPDATESRGIGLRKVELDAQLHERPSDADDAPH
ncbi:metal-dependent hydrolase [Bradymonadaceae bacterium TMQ3]|uniref:Metal-dependent hydrolase n=1 Tax=Lujinxingia sediminis TaxID=2480984 RepID=A0ABY0CTP6_9DELT|nr:metal-dependent hydrolase [Lujinxingia sediminis]RDV37617.1 metal-dependent hydrolase [Bradymonadaceae bacterium TMQ3]RVU45700.1 metal-dependent hydrolase [Lujinxingia sediminis]TXC75169.1 metal-dependent hydrolase [Bradymonadales bacterium TMQ1]